MDGVVEHHNDAITRVIALLPAHSAHAYKLRVGRSPAVPPPPPANPHT